MEQFLPSEVTFMASRTGYRALVNQGLMVILHTGRFSTSSHGLTKSELCGCVITPLRSRDAEQTLQFLYEDNVNSFMTLYPVLRYWDFKNAMGVTVSLKRLISIFSLQPKLSLSDTCMSVEALLQRQPRIALMRLVILESAGTSPNERAPRNSRFRN